MLLSRLLSGVAVCTVVACADVRTSADKSKVAEPKTEVAALHAKLDSAQRQLDSVKHANDQRVADSIHRERTMPRTLSLFADTTVVQPPKRDYPGYALSSFSLPSRGNCKVSGRLEVTAGGNKDVIVLLFRRDDFINWKNNSETDGAAIYSAGPQSVATFSVKLDESGIFDLVISNRFSQVTDKVVVGAADVVCIGAPIPVRPRAG